MSKTLEERLTGLLIPLPAAVVPRVLAQARKRNVGTARRPPWLAPVAAVFLVLGFLAGSLYAAPRFADALASAPLIGGPTAAVLRSIGLAPLNNRLTAINDVATSSGYRVTLIAGYADATQTVLVLRVEPPADLFETSVLTDQFGRSLRPRNGVFDSSTGNSVISFAGLPWGDSLLGARLTLHASALHLNLGGPVTTVPGNWSLHAILAVEPGQPLSSSGQVQAFRSTCASRGHWHPTSPIWSARRSRTCPSRTPSSTCGYSMLGASMCRASRAR
ncbi:MAG: DUF4179 domain-containing protein [Chloroflexi bacterium]|nr:MAG: DUF4179 domain-containing protein [Chloroflexota bacterium]